MSTLSPQKKRKILLEKWCSDLKEDGFAIVKGVLSRDECATFYSEARKEMIQRPHMGHSKVMWNMRLNPNLRHVFETCWDTQDLISSFDGLTSRDAGVSRSFTIGWHVDQDSRHGKGLQCVQGLVAILPSNKDSGSTSLLKGSHLVHETLSNRYEDRGDEWESFMVPNKNKIFSSCEIISPNLEAGDLLLWDSRCLHKVAAPESPMTHPRMVAYVSMMPAWKASAKTLRDRKLAYETGILTTHWASYVCDRGEEHSPHLKWKDTSAEIQNLVMGKNHPRMCSRFMR